MKFRIQIFCKLFVAAAVVSWLSGCGGSAKTSPSKNTKSSTTSAGGANTDSDGHKNHKEEGEGLSAADIEKIASYAEAMHEIGELREQVEHLIKSDNLSDLLKVHAPAKGITEIAKRLPELAKKSGIPNSQWRDINIQSSELANMFDAIDVVADDKKKAETEAVFAKMEKLIDGLKAFAPKDEHKEGDEHHKD